jgi:phosphate starvation-inducible protein PhoH
LRKLQGIKGIATIMLDQADIVRHRLVQDIVLAYEKKPVPAEAEEEIDDAPAVFRPW